MIDYAKNIQAFYERDDYKALAGQSGATAVEASFKDLTYVPRKKEGKPDSVKVTYHCGMVTVSEWLCPDHGGYAASRYKARMTALGATAVTTDQALAEASKSWTVPDKIKIKPRADDPRFNEIVQLDYSGGRKPKPVGQDLSWDGDIPEDEDIDIPF